MSNKVVIIRDMSAGNAEVGEMWQETMIFDAYTPLKEVLDWASPNWEKYGTKKHITITVPHYDV